VFEVLSMLYVHNITSVAIFMKQSAKIRKDEKHFFFFFCNLDMFLLTRGVVMT
jgi:hypothetical protein